jgi:hypothetical protein
LVIVFAVSQERIEMISNHPLKTPLEILSDMRWLEGAWRGDFEGTPFEAIYSGPDGGAIISVSKEYHQGKRCFFEFEKFLVEGDTIVMTPYPNGEKSDSFPLKSYDINLKQAIFENKAHDFPTTFSYRRLSSDTLLIVVSGIENGKLRELTARLTRISNL